MTGRVVEDLLVDLRNYIGTPPTFEFSNLYSHCFTLNPRHHSPTTLHQTTNTTTSVHPAPRTPNPQTYICNPEYQTPNTASLHPEAGNPNPETYICIPEYQTPNTASVHPEPGTPKPQTDIRNPEHSTPDTTHQTLDTKHKPPDSRPLTTQPS